MAWWRIWGWGAAVVSLLGGCVGAETQPQGDAGSTAVDVAAAGDGGGGAVGGDVQDPGVETQGEGGGGADGSPDVGGAGDGTGRDGGNGDGGGDGGAVEDGSASAVGDAGAADVGGHLAAGPGPGARGAPAPPGPGGGPDLVGPDAGAPDAGVPDAAVPDAAVPDAAVPDAAVPDAAVSDAGVPDAGVPDAAMPEDAAEQPDTESPPTATLNEVQCTGGDWIELAAAPSSKLGGLLLTDTPGSASKTWALPAGTVTPSTGLLVVSQAAVGASGFPFGVKCGDDTLWILRPDGSVVDSVVVPPLASGATLGRVPDGNGSWIQTSPSPGAPNEPFADLQSVLYDPMRVATVDLWIDDAGLAALWQDPYTYVNGRIRVAMDGYASPVMEVGLRLKGHIGSFRTLNDKAAFKVKFNHQIKGTKWLGLKKLTLNNMVQDPSMVREAISYALLRGLGLPAARTGYAWVRLNNRDYGLYLDLEAYDDVFLDKHFPTTQHLYEGEYGADVVAGSAPLFQVDEGDEADLSDLEALIAAAATPAGQAWIDAVGATADLEEMRLQWAAEIFMGHWDGYAPTVNNYYLHSDAQGRFSMLAGGTDQTLSSLLDFYGGTGLLFKRCMESWPCHEAYDVQLVQVAATAFALELGQLTEDLTALLAPWIEADPRAPYSPEQATFAAQEAVDFLEWRLYEVTSDYGCLLGDQCAEIVDPGCGDGGCATGCDDCGGGATCNGGFCVPVLPTCAGSCGGEAPGGCWCDPQCWSSGDCCHDHDTVCVGPDDTCGGYCGGMSPGGCYCDAACEVLHDCCPDRGAACGGCGCSAKTCGDDGCGGSCGVCSAGSVCDATGQCVAAPAEGCAALGGGGCGGCPCEACVCGADPLCCYVAWDAPCAARCAGDCGALSGCGAP